nr:hypothetical protein [Rhizobium sp. AB2/73]
MVMAALGNRSHFNCREYPAGAEHFLKTDESFPNRPSMTCFGTRVGDDEPCSQSVLIPPGQAASGIFVDGLARRKRWQALEELAVLRQGRN